MAVNPEITILLDLYGDMLTEKERNALDYYYNDDLSLAEIAENENAERKKARQSGGEPSGRETITRQGVHDTIKRAEAKLLDIEAKLRLTERAERQSEVIGRIKKQLDIIDRCNLAHGCYHDISSATLSIRTVLNELEDV